jgi:hypothetical protein
MSKRLHVKYPLFLSDFNKILIFSTRFRTVSNIKFRQNLSSGSRVVPCKETDMTKLTVAFRNFANATKKNVTVTKTEAVLLFHFIRQKLTCVS